MQNQAMWHNFWAQRVDKERGAAAKAMYKRTESLKKLAANLDAHKEIR